MYDWKIHIVDDMCLFPGMVDAHTHGLDKYDSPELQFVLSYPPEYIGGILNELGEKISAGEKLKDGDIVTVSVLACELKIFKTEDCCGKPILRIIVPDGIYNWPEESTEYPYNMQLTSPYEDVDFN